jgi:voltage-gated potassium channel
MSRKTSILEDAFDNPDSRVFRYANDLLAFATIVSVAGIVLETVGSLKHYHSTFKMVEYVTVALFSAEYILRVLSTKNKTGYIFSFFGIIDLVAIIPTFLGIGNLSFLKTARALRILRFLRMVRLAKLVRVGKQGKEETSLTTLNMQIYGLALVCSLLVLGTLLFIFEGHEAYAKDIPSGMYWAFKVVLGGMSYQQPVSIEGTVVLVLGRFVSLILLGLMLNLIGSLTKKALIGSDKE